LGLPQPGWDVARMDEKLRWMLRFVLDEARIDALSDCVWRFDELACAAEVIELLVQDRASENAAPAEAKEVHPDPRSIR
jgi:hypothetical protein